MLPLLIKSRISLQANLNDHYTPNFYMNQSPNKSSRLQSSRQADLKDLKEKLYSMVEEVEAEFKVEEIGRVKAFKDGVVEIEGLNEAVMGELVEFENQERGLILNLEKDVVKAVVLTNKVDLTTGQKVARTGRLLTAGVGDHLLGRVVDGLGEVINEGDEVEAEEFLPLDKIAPGVMERQGVDEPLQTGIKAIDAMIPIGRGQRELIIGDRQTGKTSIALQTIINQQNQNVVCIYTCIGQKRSSLARIQQILKDFNALPYTIIVAATASDSAAKQYLAPYTATAIAEYFLKQGKDALVVYDDLSKHAKAYREISLLLRRPSGREAYPGDVFYLHSRLLERACRLSNEYGGGSITALPIVETQANDVSAYIPTNVISITDGQIYLEPDLFNKGMRPAINVGLSVSRVGSSAQVKAMKQVAGTMKLDLAQYRELEAFVQFSSDLDKKTRAQLDRGMRVNAVLKQNWDNPLPVEEQVVIIFAAVNGFLDPVKVENIQLWEKEYLEYMRGPGAEVLTGIAESQKLTDEIEARLKEHIGEFNRRYLETYRNNGSPEEKLASD